MSRCVLLGTGKSRAAWLTPNGIVWLTAKEGVRISPEEWREHADKLRLVKSLGIAPTPHIYSVESDGLFVDRVPGASWRDLAGNPPNNTLLSEPQEAGLAALAAKQVSVDHYVGDLNPKNLVWHGGEWWVIDCGSIRSGSGREPGYVAHKIAAWAQKYEVDLRM